MTHLELDAQFIYYLNVFHYAPTHTVLGQLMQGVYCLPIGRLLQYRCAFYRIQLANFLPHCITHFLPALASVAIAHSRATLPGKMMRSGTQHITIK